MYTYRLPASSPPGWPGSSPGPDPGSIRSPEGVQMTLSSPESTQQSLCRWPARADERQERYEQADAVRRIAIPPYPLMPQPSPLLKHDPAAVVDPFEAARCIGRSIKRRHGFDSETARSLSDAMTSVVHRDGLEGQSMLSLEVRRWHRDDLNAPHLDRGSR